MPDGPSSFMSHAQLLGLNEEEVRAAQDRARQEYEAALADAQGRLQTSGQEARNNAATGGPTQLSRVGSYGDYLKARAQAEGAYQRLRSGGGRGLDGVLNRGVGDAAGAAPGDEFDAREGRLDAWAGREAGLVKGSREAVAQRAAQDKAAAAAMEAQRAAVRQRMASFGGATPAPSMGGGTTRYDGTQGRPQDATSETLGSDSYAEEQRKRLEKDGTWQGQGWNEFPGRG